MASFRPRWAVTDRASEEAPPHLVLDLHPVEADILEQVVRKLQQVPIVAPAPEVFPNAVHERAGDSRFPAPSHA